MLTKSDLNPRWSGNSIQEPKRRIRYIVTHTIDDHLYDSLTNDLAIIEMRKDRRFTWTLLPRYPYAAPLWPHTEHKQGVCNTLEEAVDFVESQW